MNIGEAFHVNPLIHHRDGVEMRLYPERQVADVRYRMAFELCVDHEARKYLPRVTSLLRMPNEALYVEQDWLGMVWVAFDRTFPALSPDEAARIAANLHVAIEDGWFPGPLPPPVEPHAAHWTHAYEALKAESDHLRWELRHPASNVTMKAVQHPAPHPGGSGEWGLSIQAWGDPYQYLGWWSIHNTGAIENVLMQKSIPSDGWFTAREAENLYKLAVMRRAGIVS